MKIPAVSVIIPLYNAEKYIAECLDSILAQTFQNFEVILVDDCSTDSSCSIVESYAEKFGGRLTLSHMEKNTGSGAAPRNKGLMLSRGEYVFNMDNDDLITRTALEELYTLAKKFDADVVYCEKHYKVNPDGSNMQIEIKQKGALIDKPELETNDLTERVRALIQKRYWVTPWCKLVRRNLLIEHGITFPHCKIADDDIWTYGLVFFAKNFLRVPNVIYLWRNIDDSITRIEKTPQQTISFWLNPIILALKTADELLGRHEFFRKNPQHRYALLEYLINYKITGEFFHKSFQLPPFVVYETIKHEFGDELGEHDVLVAALCTALNTQQKINSVNQQRFQKFAAQAQRRIAELEDEVKRLKGLVV